MHLLPFSEIYIPATRRYFKSSHTGLWRMCRYALIPTLLANSTFVTRNFTTIALTNSSQINSLKNQTAQEEYIGDFLNAVNDLPDPVTEIDNTFRQALYAQWITNSSHFSRLKNIYKTISDAEQLQNGSNDVKYILIDPTNATEIKRNLGAAIATVSINGTDHNYIVPAGLKSALFDNWEEKPNVLYLLWAFARDMNISIESSISGSYKAVLQPPKPPRKGMIHGGYEYKPFGRLDHCNVRTVNWLGVKYDSNRVDLGRIKFIQ